MSKLSRITNICARLEIPFDSVKVSAGYKSVYFEFPSRVVESLYNSDGELAEEYDAFCDKYGVWYDSDYDSWAMYL